MAKKGYDKQKRLGRADPEWQAKTRQKIQDSQVLNVVIDHALGKNEISSTRLKACEMLMDRSLPRLSSTTISGDPDNPHHATMTVTYVNAGNKRE